MSAIGKKQQEDWGKKRNEMMERVKNFWNHIWWQMFSKVFECIRIGRNFDFTINLNAWISQCCRCCRSTTQINYSFEHTKCIPSKYGGNQHNENKVDRKWQQSDTPTEYNTHTYHTFEWKSVLCISSTSTWVFRMYFTDVDVFIVLHLKMFKVCLLRISFEWIGRMQLFPLFLSHTTIRCPTQRHTCTFIVLYVCISIKRRMLTFMQVFEFLTRPKTLSFSFRLWHTLSLRFPLHFMYLLDYVSSLHLPCFLVFVHLCVVSCLRLCSDFWFFLWSFEFSSQV